MSIRKINTKEFTTEYDKRVKREDYLSTIRTMEIGDSIGIPANNKADSLRIQHGVINDSSRRRKLGKTVRYQTVTKDTEVWVRRVE